jgi:hypothetical protein
MDRLPGHATVAGTGWRRGRRRDPAIRKRAGRPQTPPPDLPERQADGRNRYPRRCRDGIGKVAEVESGQLTTARVRAPRGVRWQRNQARAICRRYDTTDGKRHGLAADRPSDGPRSRFNR